MRKSSIEVGQKYPSRSCGNFEIMEVLSYKKIKVRFTTTGFEAWVQGGQVTDGRISDKLSPTVYGVGILGLVSGKVLNRKSYKIWHAMLQRCYSKEAKTRDKNATYDDVSVCKEWLTFTNFELWFDNNYKEGFHLDKDLTVIGAREYSPTNCSFIPNLVNCLLWRSTKVKGDYPLGVHKDKETGKYVAQVSVKGMKRLWLGYYTTPEEAFTVYKSKKEAIIKEVAEKAYNNEQISSAVYQNLLRYEVCP